MTFPVLPLLKANNNVRVFTEFGVWSVRGREALDELSRGLKVDKIETEISSIPDMWARPMLFEMALLNPDHVLHQRILGEWRGLLAMLALKEVANLNRLTATQISLPPLPQIEDANEQTEAEQRDFIRTVTKLLPRASMASDTTWQTLYIFLFNGKPVGMTSPMTLVVTAADYLNRISNQDVSWYNGTHLKDPVSLLSARQKQILAGWLSNLIVQMRAHRTINLDRWNLLAGLLASFREELGEGHCNLSDAGFGIQGPDAGFFKYLDKPADGNVQDASHVRLIPSEGRTPAKPLLVLDRSIAEQWDMAPQDVTVQGAQTLASAKVDVTDAEVWKAADFFTKKLFMIFQENAFPGALGAGNQSLTMPGGTTAVTPLLPIRSELMNHLTADDLANRVRWEQTPDGLKIRLFLRLSGSVRAVADDEAPTEDTPVGRTIELTKLYRRDDIQTLDNVPILEIWPNFKADGWKAYYTCYSTDDVTSTFTVKPFAPGRSIDSEVNLKGRAKRRYWRTESYPEAMICGASVANAESKQIEQQDAGVLLLKQPDQVVGRGRSYKVGVDFGATNTTVCARFGDERLPIKFVDRKISVTASGERGQAELFNFFLPGIDSEMPVLSFFEGFDNNLSGRELHPFLNGHIYLLPNVPDLDPNRFKAPGMALDLKWSSEDRDRRMVKAFLLQLCLQTCAELVNAGATYVGWAFSYPTAFSEAQIKGFPEIWNQVTTDCIALTGLSRTTPNVRNTESVATALYFVKHLNAATAMGTIFIDIGGSTSDISVWQGDNKKGPVWQTSVLLAGRDIFSNYLWHNPDFLGLFGVGAFELSRTKDKSSVDKKIYYAMTDALLRFNSKALFAELPVHAGTERVKNFQQHLALGVCGLFYYVGSILRYLMENGVYRSNIPNVYVGGNGSQIFRWLDIDDDEHINALYKTVFSQGAGWTDDQPFKVILSPEPKMEAAYGLVEDWSLGGGEAKRRVLAGESFVVEDQVSETAIASGDVGPPEHKWNTVLTGETFTHKLSPPVRLERLMDFISAFNNFAKENELVSLAEMPKDQIAEVRRSLGESLRRYQEAKSTASIIVEPIFIIALRHWLEIRLGG